MTGTARSSSTRSTPSWSDNGTGYRVLGFPMGWLFKHPVGVFEVDGGEARPFDFGTDDFSFHDQRYRGAGRSAEPFPGSPACGSTIR